MLSHRRVVAVVGALTLSLVVAVSALSTVRTAPNMMVSFSGGGQGFPAGYIKEPFAFIYPLIGATGPYRVRITAVRLIGDGQHPLPRLVHVALTKTRCHSGCFINLFGPGSSISGTFQEWPPISFIQTAIGNVESNAVPILSLHRTVLIGRQSHGTLWSLVVDVAGYRRHTSFQFSGIAVTVIWRGKFSTQMVPDSQGTLSVA